MLSRLTLVLLFAAIFVPAASQVEAAGRVRKTKDSCKNAYAILGWSDFKKAAHESDAEFEERAGMPWEKVGWILGRRTYLKHVDEVEHGVVNQVSFRQYRVKGHDNALGYVANCGHGGTCNQIATVLYDIYKGIGVPSVECGVLPSVLIDPVKPTIPIPTEDELAAADDGGYGDDDFDDDWGDDDE